MPALCDPINKWSVKTSSVLCIEQILQFEVCQQNIIVWMNKICHPWNSDALYLISKGSFTILLYTWDTTVYQVYPSAVSAREVLYLRWILGHQIVGKVKFWDSRRCPDLRRKQKTYKTFWYCYYYFIYLFIYLFIFWSVHFCIKFGWDFFIFISILIKKSLIKTRFNSEPLLLLNKHFFGSLSISPRSLTRDIFRSVFDSRSSFFALKPQGNACYAG